MFKLTLHRLIFILTFGVLYSAMHIYFDLDIRSMTFTTFFTMFWSITWGVVFLKRPEWKDKYTGQ